MTHLSTIVKVMTSVMASFHSMTGGMYNQGNVLAPMWGYIVILASCRQIAACNWVSQFFYVIKQFV